MTWAEGVTVRFRILEGVRVERGQLVKVEDSGRTYVMRVYDFKPESLLTPAEIAAASNMAAKNGSVELYDKPLRLYDTALATILCQIEEGGRVQGPTSVPRLFTQVDSLEREDLKSLNLGTGDLVLGVVRVGHRPSDALVALDGSKVIPHHVLVCGVTGAGKSNLGKVLAAAFMLAAPLYSLVLFDVESEYLTGSEPGKYGLAHLPVAEERLFVVTPRVDEPTRLKLRLEIAGNELEREVLAHPLKVEFSALRPSDFTMTGEFTEPQEEFLWLAYRNFEDEWLEILATVDSRSLHKRLNGMAPVNTIAVTKRKVRHLLGVNGVFVPKAPGDLFNAVLGAVQEGRLVLFDMPFASEGEEKLLTIAVARRIFHAYERARKYSPEDWEKMPYVMIAVEEAHRYLSKQAAGGEVRENIFSTIAKRGRKYKVGALYITQMPGELIETVIRQSLTKIILPLPTKPDLIKVIQYSPYLDEAEQEIRTLDKGEALLVSPPSGIRFAVPLKIFNYEELVEALLTNEVSHPKAAVKTV
ncbi:MAG: ATP-binding protein [Thermofilaceae archaeon]|nr:ATP-binding protein [Thermofilaceae archaeon]